VNGEENRKAKCGSQSGGGSECVGETGI